jgi:hypothetical protein
MAMALGLGIGFLWPEPIQQFNRAVSVGTPLIKAKFADEFVVHPLVYGLKNRRFSGKSMS